ncbi:MAG: CopG family ribbon-helix-helix protein [Candidatus Woesearchaeota archaeon]|nr:CopG family ribbon-helix-helix protein [Candidatus Woesearchaeota archaeon]
MTIMSISLNDNIIKDMDNLQKELGYSGRSEMIRAGIRMLIASERENSKLSGKINGTLIVVNEEKDNEDISKIRHDHNEIIKTQIHNHMDSHKCLQIFILEGDAKKIKLLVNELQTSKKADYVKLVIP